MSWGGVIAGVGALAGGVMASQAGGGGSSSSSTSGAGSRSTELQALFDQFTTAMFGDTTGQIIQGGYLPDPSWQMPFDNWVEYNYKGGVNKDTGKPIPQTDEEVYKEYEQYLQDYKKTGGTGYVLQEGQSYADLLDSASKKVIDAIGSMRTDYDKIAAERTGMYDQIKATQDPINISFGGQGIGTFTPHTAKLNALLEGQKADTALKGVLAEQEANYSLMPREKMFDVVKNIGIPMETARYGVGTTNTSSSQDATLSDVMGGVGAVSSGIADLYKAYNASSGTPKTDTGWDASTLNEYNAWNEY